MLLMVINSEKHRGILTHSWQHLCSPFHALFLIKCVWLQHNTTFTLGSTVTEHYDLLRNLRVPRDTCFAVYIFVGGRLGFRKAGNWGDWNDKSLFASVILFFFQNHMFKLLEWKSRFLEYLAKCIFQLFLLHLEPSGSRQVWLYNIYNKTVTTKRGCLPNY